MMGRIALVIPILAALAVAGEQPYLAVGRDGQIIAHKEMTLDAPAKVLHWKARTYPLSSLYLVEALDTGLIWAADYDSRMRGYELIARDRVRTESGRLLRAALRFKDPALARRLFDLAVDNGLNGKDAEKYRESLRRLEARDPKPKKWAEDVRKQADRLAFLHADILYRRTKRELQSDPATGLRMLRDLIRLAPRHEPSRLELVRLAPGEFPLGGPRDWLDWKLDILDRGAKLAMDDSFTMRQAKKHWRTDLVAVEVGPALVLTPVRDTRVLGRTVGCCRLLTDLLDSHFGGYPKRRTKVQPLRIFLYGSRDEYKKQSQASRPGADAEFLERTAGHYSPEEGISRLFWSTSRNAEQRTVATAVHELTHHWLAEANPAYNRVEGRRSPRCPGFWIVEGFAKFLEEGVYNLDDGTWSLFDRRATSLDTLASMATSRRLIPWKTLYEGTSVTFWALPKKADILVRRRWRLGSETLSTTQLWYEQSAATCHFLYHAENGKYRKALIDFVVNHYTNKKERMPVHVAFGMTPEQLGKRVVEFAQAVAKGWEPGEG